MTDYIKREDTLKAMDTWDKFGCDGHGRLVPYTEEYVPYVKFDDMMKAVEGQPSADVAPVRHGKWEAFEDMMLDTCYRCSECGREFYLADCGTPQENEYNYCPNCGAKMDEVKDDDKID